MEELRVKGGMKNHRFLTLNIQHGGGSRIGSIVAYLDHMEPDTVVLTEFRNSARGKDLLAELSTIGLGHHAHTDLSSQVNGVLVASRQQLDNECLLSGADAWGQSRHIRVGVDGWDLHAVYLPSGRTKLIPWDRILDAAQLASAGRAIFLGDFNTGRHFIDEDGATFIGAQYPGRLESLGFIDTWRLQHPQEREPSWVSGRGNGFRLDYAYLASQHHECLDRAWFDHSTRIDKITDHSALIVDMRSSNWIGTGLF